MPGQAYFIPTKSPLSKGCFDTCTTIAEKKTKTIYRQERVIHVPFQFTREKHVIIFFPFHYFLVFFLVDLNPDPELKNIIDKLANFVARNGPEFEKMTKHKQMNNPKFNFLYGGEFFNYYQCKVATEQQRK